LAAGASTDTTNLVVIGTALVAGYVFELRPDGRSPLPVALAFVVVLLRAASPAEFVAIACITPLVAVTLRTEPRRLADRTVLLAEFLAEGLGAGAAFYLIVRADNSLDQGLLVFCALAGAVVVELLVADTVTFVRTGHVARLRGRGADLALATSGMLMAIGYGGVGGQGRLGLWGPFLFSIPLVAAWYSYELFARTRRTFEQTVHALGVVPELGGLVRQGHAERVARLAVALGEQLGVGDTNLRNLETAAWLHHLGAVSLDEPQQGSLLDAGDVASAGADMLRSSNALTDAGDIVAAEPALHRTVSPLPDTPAVLMGQILKVASAYDELTGGDDLHASWAVDALFTGPAYVYDGNVLVALDVVLRERGSLKG